jgi:aquaporin Z
MRLRRPWDSVRSLCPLAPLPEEDLTRMLAPSEVVRAHWPEYLMEAAGLGLFMISAAVVTSLLEYPHSPLYDLLPDPVIRRVLIGIAMGLTAIGIIYSPWGKQSGAHLNPAVTVTFFRLGKVRGPDALFYVLAQFVGGLIGLRLAALAIGMAIEHPAVNYVVTVPGVNGAGIAFVAEAGISFLLMLIVLIVSNQTQLNAWTGLFAGALVATYIAVEAPLSGMSMNPARSFASALPAHLWTDFWVYLTAPLLGMLLAAECYVRFLGAHRVLCAKLHHHNNTRCIFRCNFTA